MNILAIIGPLVLLALLGFICTKSHWLDKSQLDVLSKFTFSLCIPAFLFYQMANANFAEQVNFSLFAAFYVPVLICFCLALGLSALVKALAKKKTKTEKADDKDYQSNAVFALGASYSNTVIVGLPVLLAAFGQQVIGIVFLVISFHSAMLFALTAAIASKEQCKLSQFDLVKFLKQTFNNPLIISIFSGLVINLLAIDLPDVVDTSLELLGKPAITLALFILGASLSFYHVSSKITTIVLATLVKLLILPALVYFSAHYVFNLNIIVTTTLVILSASPTGVNAYLIALQQKSQQELVAGTVVVSTLLSTLTIPLWLVML